MEDGALNAVNPHYLERVMAASAHREIETCEDVYTQSGVKLLSKGARISHEVKDKLAIHKLRKPLENCLAVKSGMDKAHLTRTIERVLDQNTALHPLIGKGSLSRSITALPLNPPTLAMLSVAESHGAEGLDHYLLVALLSLGLGYKLQLGENDMQVLASAGLLHDVGELYIDQRYLDTSRVLTPEEWRHLSVHPVVGFRLATEICGFSSKVGEAILHHHERGEGGGYPSGITQAKLALPARIVGTAEMVASLANFSEYPLERAEVAARIVPGEYDRELISVLSRALGDARNGKFGVQHILPTEQIQALLKAIARALGLFEQYEAASPQHGSPSQKLLERAFTRFKLIIRAYSSTGLDIQDSSNPLDTDASDWMFAEIDMILHEIRWRLRELARDIALRSSQISADEAQYFQPLVEMLHARI
ncbi:Cyclic di-GMP phosphodiesterase response regulator RpfG [Andreprevotia sp. IGB-42]|uniref:HD-GYP domain-containing protein n=1 Tax=Andreprevotia sp. IGB-42 TaxID=2497473 RepID=UPI00135AE937|nr:HD domain-containing phosphohydrolase [Andreprevotia sp. IGB-42]KAF0811341.1 Cyclic di-GMP phosphodiesterase response regulator RpfG [Andreprevotia sp. IGB-42]